MTVKEVFDLRKQGKIEEAYEAKCASEDQEMLPFMERGVFLQVIDREWQDYLRAMDDLRHGVSLRAYAQRDPLVEYKKEAFGMFETLMTTIKTKVVSGEFRSTTARNMRRILAEIEASRRAAVTNGDAISVDGDPRAGGSRQEAPRQRGGEPTVGDAFAAMMSQLASRGAPAPSSGALTRIRRSRSAIRARGRSSRRRKSWT